MATWVDDLTGLNATRMRDRPVVADLARAQALAAASPDTSLSIAGMRHSQGGHTMVPDGRMLQTTVEFNRIWPPRRVTGQAHDGLIEAEAGATWEELHRVLGRHGLAPMVQQSSADFSVGGSLSVNCHGRDPRWGPMSSSVEDVTVLTGRGDVVTASRTQDAALFRAVIGGYGACGQILKATLRAVANARLQYRGDVRRRHVDDYVGHANALLGKTDIHLHYAWLCCVPDRFFDELLIADLVHVPMPEPFPVQWTFKEQSWGAEEILRAGWAAARKDPHTMRAAVWDQLWQLHRVGGDGGKGSVAHRIDWLRASVSFTAFRGEQSTDILQEYFVPLDQLRPMIDALKRIYTDPLYKTNVLSATLRLVRADDETVLSYCQGSPRVSIAVDADVATVDSAQGGGRKDLHPAAAEAIRLAIAEAMRLGGSYYLPYQRVAEKSVFRAAYPRHAELHAAIDEYNPLVNGRHRYWNNFLANYFS